MFDLNKARKFDILAYKSQGKNDFVAGFIDLMSVGGKYAHIAVLSDYNYEEKQWYIWESHFEGGVVKKPLNTKWYPFIDGYRLKGFIDKYDDALLSQAFDSYVGEKYALLAFPSTFFHSTLAQVFGWKHYAKKAPLFDVKNGLYCSEYAAKAFYKGRHILLRPDLNLNCITPGDITVSKKIKLVYA